MGNEPSSQTVCELDGRQFKLHGQIGEGSFSLVYEGPLPPSNQPTSKQQKCTKRIAKSPTDSCLSLQSKTVQGSATR